MFCLKNGWVNRLICKIFGHDLHIVKTFSPEIRQVRCKMCGKTFGMHDGVQAFVPWDNELESAMKFYDETGI